MATTEGYIKHAENYYRGFPVDWIACAPKSTEDTMTGLHKENGYKGENQQTADFESVDTLSSSCEKWARRDLNSRPPGYQPGAPTNLSYGPDRRG